jgi:hypothetical protein
MKQPKLGSGERFKRLVENLKGKVSNPKAVAASIGMKKYGKEKMMKMAQAGRKAKATMRPSQNRQG